MYCYFYSIKFWRIFYSILAKCLLSYCLFFVVDPNRFRPENVYVHLYWPLEASSSKALVLYTREDLVDRRYCCWVMRISARFATLFSTMCVAHSMCSSSSGARGEMYTYNQRIKTRIKAHKFNNGLAMYVLSTGYWFFVWCIFLLRGWNWYYVLRTWRSRVHVLRKSGIKIVMRYSTFIVQFCTFCIKCQTIYDSKRIFIKQHNSSILCIRSAYFLNTFLQEK